MRTVSGILEQGLPLTVAGAAAALDGKRPHRVPFSLARATLQHRQEPSRTANVAGPAWLSQSDNLKFRRVCR
jgi:hypothetical protein